MDKELRDVIHEFSKQKNVYAVESNEIQALTKRLQEYLDTKFPCDLDAFSGFADMYRQEDFSHNIDTMSTKGTAEFIAEAIEYYCYK